jgi:hypothetical protein
VLKRHLLLPCLLIASALAFSACGGGSSDTSQIEEAIEASATSTDPGECTKFETQQFVEQGAEESGKAALKECEKNATESTGKAKSVVVSKVEVDGSKATANAAVVGGGFDGQTVEIALVKEGDQWKLNEITGFAKLDKTKVAEIFKREFAKPSSEVSESLGTCVVEGLEEASQSEIEALVLEDSSAPIEELAEACS